MDKLQQQISCSNCLHNPLQDDSLGLSVGYCTKYKVVLKTSDDTTCAQHLRKGLMADSAIKQQLRYKITCASTEGIQSFNPSVSIDDVVSIDTSLIKDDVVGEVVCNEKLTPFDMISNLIDQNSIRSNLALITIAREYCIRQEGNWKSLIPTLILVHQSLSEKVPDVIPTDIRYQKVTLTPERQVELIQWSILMSKLMFISDVGRNAASDNINIGELASIANQAALQSKDIKFNSLYSWVQRRGIPTIKHIIDTYL